MQSYDYAHRDGVDEISWERFEQLSAALAEQLAAHKVEVVIGVARAGLFPATAVALALRSEFYPVRVTRRVNTLVTYDHPVWKVRVPAEVAGRVVAVIDEIADSGETVQLVANEVRRLGAAKVVTATLVRHSWASPVPDACALVSDALVVFPWGRQVLVDGAWQPDPELAEALLLQKKTPSQPQES
jgi:uncharacterized protein